LDQQMLYPTDEPEHPHPPCPVTGAHYERPKVIYQEEPDFTEGRSGRGSAALSPSALLLTRTAIHPTSG
jgi:hypothetical protein